MKNNIEDNKKKAKKKTNKSKNSKKVTNLKSKNTKTNKQLSSSRITNVYRIVFGLIMTITIVFLIYTFIRYHSQVNDCIQDFAFGGKDYINTMCSPYISTTRNIFLKIYGLFEFLIPGTLIFFALGRYLYIKFKYKKELNLNDEVYQPIFIMLLQGVFITFIVSLFMFITNIKIM